MKSCHGTLEDHCCWFPGGACEFLERGTVEGRIWACGLYRELGDWSVVHADARWLDSRAADWFATHFPGFGCGDWPQNVLELRDARVAGIGLCCYG